MWGAIIGAAVSAIGSAVGSAASRNERNNALAARQNYINKKLRDNENWYNREYNEDLAQRADAQAILTRTEKFLRRRNAAAEARKTILGGTDESVAEEKERNNQVYADTMSQLALANQQRKDAIRQQYLDRKEHLEDSFFGLESQKVNSNGGDVASSIAGGVFNGLSGVLSGIGGSTNKTNK